jgi:hypothetical protein
MTRQEFNEKYKQWIPEGWSGLDFDVPQVTEYVDKIMQDLIMIPGFELHQIKLKFDWPRFYFTTSFKNKDTELAIAMRIQERINAIIKQTE